MSEWKHMTKEELSKYKKEEDLRKLEGFAIAHDTCLSVNKKYFLDLYNNQLNKVINLHGN